MVGLTLLVIGLSIYSGETASADLELRGQILGSYITKDSNNSFGFSIRRARIILDGFLFSKKIKYYEQLTVEGGSLSLRDLYLTIKPLEIFGVTLGQFKVPYNREELTSSSKLELVERSITNEYFFLGRDIGVDVSFGPEKYKLRLGAFTGAGRNITRLDPTVRPSKNLLYTARLELSPLGKFIYDQPNLKGEKAVNIGGSVAVFPLSTAESIKITDRSDLSDFIKRYVIQERNLRSSGTLLQGESDLKIWWDFVGLELEGLYAKFRDFGEAFGLRAQPSVVFQNFGFALRYSLISPKGEKNIWEITAGPSYYFHGHNLKVQADYSFISDPTFNEKRNLIRVQLQFVVK
jgi:hypothetical protein